MMELLDTDVYINDNFFQNQRINKISTNVNELDSRIVLGTDDPVDTDGRPDGTIYLKYTA